MKANINSIDRIIRLIIAVVVAALYFTNVITGTVGIVLLIVAAVLLLTSIINFCPLYYLLGISTSKK